MLKGLLHTTYDPSNGTLKPHWISNCDANYAALGLSIICQLSQLQWLNANPYPIYCVILLYWWILLCAWFLRMSSMILSKSFGKQPLSSSICVWLILWSRQLSPRARPCLSLRGKFCDIVTTRSWDRGERALASLLGRHVFGRLSLCPIFLYLYIL